MKRFAMILLSGVFFLTQIGCSTSAGVQKNDWQAVDKGDWSNVYVLDVYDHVNVMLKDSSVVEGRFSTARGEFISVLTPKKKQLFGVFEVGKGIKERVERSNVFRVEKIPASAQTLREKGCEKGGDVGVVIGSVLAFIDFRNGIGKSRTKLPTYQTALLAVFLGGTLGVVVGCVAGVAIAPERIADAEKSVLIYEAR